jgi:hypothetical protein
VKHGAVRIRGIAQGQTVIRGVRAQVLWRVWIGAFRPVTLICCALWSATFLFNPLIGRAIADDAPKVEAGKNPGELKLPSGLLVDDGKGKGGLKLRDTTCPDKCKAQWEALKAALTAYYAAQSLEGYQNSGKGQNFKDQEKNGNSGMKNILGMSDKDMIAARKDITTAKKDPQKKDSVTSDALLKAVNAALAALVKCEKDCGGTTEGGGGTTEGGTTEGGGGTTEGGDKGGGGGVCHWNGFDKLPGNVESKADIKATTDWCKGITLPTCSDDKTKTKQELDQLLADLATAKGYIEAGGKFGALADETKNAVPICEKAIKDVKDFITDKLPNLPPCPAGEKKKEECPPPKSKTGSYYVPPQRTPGTFYVSQNGEAVCTYDNGRPYEVAYTPISSGGQVIATYTPPAGRQGGAPAESTPSAPTGGNTPDNPSKPPAADNPPRQSTPDNPPKQPTSDNPPPPTTDNPVPTTTADNPPTDTSQDDEVETFDKENVDGPETGSGLQTQMVMLATVKPGLVRTEDGPGSGFDRNPAKTRIVNGHGVIRVNRADRQAFGLPDSGDQPAHVRLDLTAMKHTSAIAEITGKTIKSDLASALPKGDQVATRIINVGPRTFMAFDFAQPFNHAEDIVALAARTLGIALEVDTCDDDKPAADLDTPSAASQSESGILPSATIRFGGHPQTTRSAR